MESIQRNEEAACRETKESIENHLIQEWGMSPETARRFVQRQPGITLNESVEYMRAVTKGYRVLYRRTHGQRISPILLRRATEMALERTARRRQPLTEKDLMYLLQQARDATDADIARKSDPSSEEGRVRILRPLREAVICEEDAVTRNRLMGVADVFIKHGYVLNKQFLIDDCLQQEEIFPNRRTVDETLEILRTSYEALGFSKDDVFIASAYLDVPYGKVSTARTPKKTNGKSSDPRFIY
ncbi:MAG: hypothetical protein GC154_20100 [bacterium]|nr:hypothetical protein [bacterium]